MKMKRVWWYVIALVAIILVVMIVFKDDVGLGPAKESNDNSLMKDLGFVEGNEKYTRTQVKKSQRLVEELQELGARNG